MNIATRINKTTVLAEIGGAKPSIFNFFTPETYYRR